MIKVKSGMLVMRLKTNFKKLFKLKILNLVEIEIKKIELQFNKFLIKRL